MTKNHLLSSYFSKVSEEKRDSAVIAYLASLDLLLDKHPSIAKRIIQELFDQRSSLKLIASENYSSLAVQLAMGNLLTDKYSEGYPYHRFYAGCDNVDAIESEACDRAKNLFGAESAYVQPHSGADANLVAFWSILTAKIQTKEVENLGKKTIDELTPEEFEKMRTLLCSQKILGLSLSSGGHLTHGYRHNVSAKMMQAFTYDVDPKTHLLDYAQIRDMAKKVKPLILLAGYSAYPRRIDFSKMKEIADEVGAVLMVDMAHFAGLVAGKAFTGVHDPIPYADIVSSTTHKTLRGPRGGLILCKKELSEFVNKGCPLILGGPLPHVMAAKAIAFEEASRPEFVSYAKKVVENAQTLANELVRQGLTVITGGTDNHLIVVNLAPLGLTGRQGETILRNGGLTLNRNMVPFDTNGAWYTSGIRLGTPATTTLGMGKEEMKEIASIIASLLKASKALPAEKGEGLSKAKAQTEENVVSDAKKRVKNLLTHFPLYPEIDIAS